MAAKVTQKALDAAKAVIAAARKIVSVSEEGFTGYDSHGSRYFRFTLPREWAAKYETPMNRFTCEIDDNGVVTYTPIRPLIEVTPKVPKGAKVAEESAA